MDYKIIKNVLNVSKLCYDTIPCYHYIKYEKHNGEVSQELKRGDEIYYLYKQLNLNIPKHFLVYEHF